MGEWDDCWWWLVIPDSGSFFTSEKINQVPLSTKKSINNHPIPSFPAFSTRKFFSAKKTSIFGPKKPGWQVDRSVTGQIAQQQCPLAMHTIKYRTDVDRYTRFIHAYMYIYIYTYTYTQMQYWRSIEGVLKCMFLYIDILYYILKYFLVNYVYTIDSHFAMKTHKDTHTNGGNMQQPCKCQHFWSTCKAPGTQ